LVSVVMEFELMPLPYPKHALEPHLGRETLTYHHEKHHAAYLKKLKELIGDRPAASRTLEEIILLSDDEVFQNAAQVWNLDFYWRSMQRDGGGDPAGALRSATWGDSRLLRAFDAAARRRRPGRRAAHRDRA